MRGREEKNVTGRGKRGGRDRGAEREIGRDRRRETEKEIG